MAKHIMLILFVALCSIELSAQENLFGEQLTEEEIKEQEYFRNIIENGTLTVKGAAMYVDGYLVNPSEILDIDLYANWLPAYKTKMVGVYFWSAGVGLAAATGVSALLVALMPDTLAFRIPPEAGLITAGVLGIIGLPIDLVGASKLKKITAEQNRRRQAGKPHTPQINFGTTNNGIGFTLNF